MKKTLKLTPRFLLLAVLLAAAGLYMPSDAQAQPYYYRWGPATPDITCTTNGGTGEITAVLSSQPVEWDLPAVSELSYIYDYNGSTSAGGPYNNPNSGVGSTVYASLGSSSLGTSYSVYFSVTLQTIVGGEHVYSSTLRGDCTMDGTFPTSVTNQEISSGGGGTTTPSDEPVPGPDLVDLPSGAVVGVFVTTTPLYYAPEAGAVSNIEIAAGKTLWVLGVDASGNFYKVLISGQYFWVPVGTMGPNFDEVWNGAPLPTQTVN